MIPRPIRVLARLVAVAVLRVACTAAPGRRRRRRPATRPSVARRQCPTAQPAALPPARRGP